MAIRKVYSAKSEALDDRCVLVQCSSGAIDRTGEIVVQAGIEFPESVPVLWNHNGDKVYGRARPRLVGENLYAEVRFTKGGIDPAIDRVCAQVKDGDIDTVSIGFNAIEAEPMDPARPKGPKKFLRCELLELSFVSIPANPDAVVIERAAETETVMNKDGAPKQRKGLYEVGRLAFLLQDLSWLEECVEWEAEYEGDGSPLPAMLADIMRAMGDALLAMTAEEVAELLAEEAAETKAFRADRLKSFGTAVAGHIVANRKAGRVLSKASMSSLAEAHGHIEKGIGCLKALMDGATVDDGEAETTEKANDETEIQTSGGTGTDGTTSKAARLRELKSLQFSRIA